MASEINRRGFLAGSAGAAMGLALASSDVLQRTAAIEPIARNGEAKFKFSLAAYSYRDLLKGDPPQLTMADFIWDCAKFGLEGTELTSYYFPEPTTPEYLRQLRRQCFRLGLDVSGTAVGNDFGFPAGEERIKQIDVVKRWIDNAAILAVPVIRIFAGHKKDEITEAQTHSLMVSALEECCDYAGQHGVHLALENHGGPTATAEGMLTFVNDVQSPWFGVNLDTGNFHTDDIYGDLAKLAPYALNVQVKVVSGPDGKREPSNFSCRVSLTRITAATSCSNLKSRAIRAKNARRRWRRFARALRKRNDEKAAISGGL